MSRRSIDAAQLGLAGAPRSFELHGALPPAPRLAIVGSRAMLHALAREVEQAVRVAAEHGHAVASGDAIGIDAAVHRAALTHGVPQLAVLPCGSDRPYPAQHRGLFEAIAAAPGSGVLFAQPSGTPPRRAMFVSRNALLVALCDACVVMQADARSGSETTGRLALRRGIAVAAVVGTPGCAALVAAGARALRPGEGPEALAAWLQGRVASLHWPQALEPLRARLQLAGARGASLDRLGGPAVALDLLRAEALGLALQIAPGVWVPAG